MRTFRECDILTAARQRLAEVQAEVAQLDREHERLGALKRQLSKDLGRSRALYRRRILANFPQELLREIFIPYSNDASSDWYNNNNWTALYVQPDYIHDWARMPYRLATVCQKWRTVALETGCLWTYITTFHGPESRNQPQTLSNLKRALTSLARSGSATLQVYLPWRFGTFDNNSPGSREVIRVAHDLLREISHAAHRLDRVLLGTSPPFVHTMYSIFKSPTPSLTFLSMEDSELGPEQVPILTGGFPLAPNLHSIELYGSGLLHTAIQCESLYGMHLLRLWHANRSSVECYVPRCSSLQSLTLNLEKGEPYGGPRLELHHLQALSLRGSMFFASEADPEPRIIAPKLRSLLLDDLDVTASHLRLVQSLNPSQLTLQYIRLPSLRHLAGFKDIRRLVFGAQSVAEPDTYMIEDEIFDYLCDTDPIVWSKLEEIVVKGEGWAESIQKTHLNS